MVGTAVALMQLGLENIGRPMLPHVWTGIILAASVVLLLAFWRYQRHVAAPAVDMTLFHLRTFQVGTLAGGLSRVGINGVPFLLPLMLQVGFGVSAVTSGSLTFVMSLGALVVRPTLSPLLRWFGFSKVLVGSAVAASAALAGFTLLGPETPHWLIAVYIGVFGLTRSVQFMSSNTLSYSDMPAAKLSRATSLGGVLQQLSVSFGVSVAAMLLGLVSMESHSLTPERFHEAFLISAVIPLLAIPGFLRLRPEDGVQVSGYVKRS
jgi:hypothetical protein